MGEHEACNDSSVMSHRDGTLATSFGPTIRCRVSGVSAEFVNPKSQAPNLKVSGVRCQVSEMIDLNTETRTLKP